MGQHKDPSQTLSLLLEVQTGYVGHILSQICILQYYYWIIFLWFHEFVLETPPPHDSLEEQKWHSVSTLVREPPGGGDTYAASKSGWFDMSKFNHWFKQGEVRFFPIIFYTFLVPWYWCGFFTSTCTPTNQIPVSRKTCRSHTYITTYHTNLTSDIPYHTLLAEHTILSLIVFHLSHLYVPVV